MIETIAYYIVFRLGVFRVKKNMSTNPRLQSAISSIKEGFTSAYNKADQSPETAETAQRTAIYIGQLIDVYLVPELNKLEQQLAAKRGAATGAATPVTAPVTTPVKAKNAWAIFLSGPAKEIPGWSEAPNKAAFASVHYKQLSDADRKKLVADWKQANGFQQGVVGTTSGAKKPRISGLDAFKKHWYARRRENNPDAKGIDPQCVADWATLSDVEKAQWKETRRQQVTGLA